MEERIGVVLGVGDGDGMDGGGEVGVSTGGLENSDHQRPQS